MQNKEQERIYFDKFSENVEWNAFTSKTYDKLVSLILGLKPGKNDVIIDMGCGTGQLTNKIRVLGFKDISGYDISKNCILKAKEHYKDITFDVRDIENTKLRDNSIDFLIYCGVLHHFSNAGKVIKEAKRILKKKGKIFVFDPNASNPVFWLFRNNSSPLRLYKMRTPNEEFKTKYQIRESFEKEGFKVIRIDCISGISYTKDYFKRLLPVPFSHLVHLYNSFDSILNVTFLRKRYGSFIYGYFEKS